MQIYELSGACRLASREIFLEIVFDTKGVAANVIALPTVKSAGRTQPNIAGELFGKLVRTASLYVTSKK